MDAEEKKNLFEETYKYAVRSGSDGTLSEDEQTVLHKNVRLIHREKMVYEYNNFVKAKRAELARP